MSTENTKPAKSGGDEQYNGTGAGENDPSVKIVKRVVLAMFAIVVIAGAVVVWVRS